MVDVALDAYLKEVKAELMEKASKIAEQKREEFLAKKNEFIEKYADHCTYFTNSFNNNELQS